MSEQKKVIFMILIIVAVILTFLFMVGLREKEENVYSRGDLTYEESNEDILTVDPYNEDWKEADKALDLEQPYSVGIIDSHGYLTESGFLPTKAHMIKCEVIGDYLQKNGIYSQNIEVTKAYKNGNNSVFLIVPMDYPDHVITVTWYGMTEEFSLSKK